MLNPSLTVEADESIIYLFKLLAMVPQPVKAVILLFPITESIETRRKDEDDKVKTQGQHPIDPTVFYIKQTARAHVLCC